MNVIIKYFWIFFNFLVIIIFGSIQHDANTQRTTPLLLNTTFDAEWIFLKFSSTIYRFWFLKSSNWALWGLARRCCGRSVARWAPSGIATAKNSIKICPLFQIVKRFLETWSKPNFHYLSGKFPFHRWWDNIGARTFLGFSARHKARTDPSRVLNEAKYILAATVTLFKMYTSKYRKAST